MSENQEPRSEVRLVKKIIVVVKLVKVSCQLKNESLELLERGGKAITNYNHFSIKETENTKLKYVK